MILSDPSSKEWCVRFTTMILIKVFMFFSLQIDHFNFWFLGHLVTWNLNKSPFQHLLKPPPILELIIHILLVGGEPGFVKSTNFPGVHKYFLAFKG